MLTLAEIIGKLGIIADGDDCDGYCDERPPYKPCPQCIAAHTLNEVGKILRGTLKDIDEFENTTGSLTTVAPDGADDPTSTDAINFWNEQRPHRGTCSSLMCGKGCPYWTLIEQLKNFGWCSKLRHMRFENIKCGFKW